MHRPSASFYSSVGGGKHFTGRRQSRRFEDPPTRAQPEGTSSTSSIDGQFNPQRACRPGARGVTTLNWFDAAFRIDRIGCP
jgi:hypothetical protein